MYTGSHFANTFYKNMELNKERDQYNGVQFPQFCPRVPEWDPLGQKFVFFLSSNKSSLFLKVIVFKFGYYLLFAFSYSLVCFMDDIKMFQQVKSMIDCQNNCNVVAQTRKDVWQSKTAF